ncbi:MAG: hypothetical protein A2104_07410 [Candidatus Melainabacteria bacterium GWF2_32_7]|nr:MAG: hypothetical protein A2104_07410 [Candidatus Melainabacteria bacterium GWF2_32_7]
MNRAELLLPAGNIEKMQYAIAYGADAVYLGIVDFSLRSMKSGNVITLENIKDAIDTAHNMGVKAYVTVNIFAQNNDIEKLPPLIEILSDAKPDGIIFGDPGFYSILKKKLPDIPLHVSTQANTLNYEAVKFWQDLGITRVILARELALREIEEIANKVPGMELEVLVHGSMCVAYSGRCLLSDYMTDNKRKSNQGGCVQPCRWKYHLVEEKRPGQYYEITEDEKGTYILNPKDQALIGHISDLINAGVCSFKVEGRTKSLYYASVVAKAYRQAIDAHYAGKSANTNELLYELSKVGNRGFTTGFLIDKPDSSHYDYNVSKGIAGATFLGTIIEQENSNTYKVLARNQFKLGDFIEWITPTQQISAEITNIINSKNEAVQVADTNDIIYLSLDEQYGKLENWHWGIIRSKEGRDGIQAEPDLCCGTRNGH